MVLGAVVVVGSLIEAVEAQDFRILAVNLRVDLQAQALVVHDFRAVAHGDVYGTGVDDGVSLVHFVPPPFL